MTIEAWERLIIVPSIPFDSAPHLHQVDVVNIPLTVIYRHKILKIYDISNEFFSNRLPQFQTFIIGSNSLIICFAFQTNRITMSNHHHKGNK